MVIVDNDASSQYDTEVATVFDEAKAREGEASSRANGHAGGAAAQEVQADGGKAAMAMAAAGASSQSPLAALRDLVCCCFPKHPKPSRNYHLLQEFDEL